MRRGSYVFPVVMPGRRTATYRTVASQTLPVFSAMVVISFPAEIAKPLGDARDRGQSGVATGLSEAFVGREEKRFPPSGAFRNEEHRAAQIESELILLEGRRARGARIDVRVGGVAGKRSRVTVEEAPRLERVIANEFPKTSVEVFGTRLCHDIDLGSAALTKLRRIVVGLDLELLHRVDIRTNSDSILEGVRIRGSVDEKRVLIGAQSRG